MGRPTKLDDETADRICEAVSLGSPLYLAARAGGIDPETLRAWKARGRKGEQPYSAFLGRLKVAEAVGVTAALTVIRKAASEGTWQAAAWILERRYPKVFGRRDVRAELKLQALSPEEAKEKVTALVRQLATAPDLRAELRAVLDESDGEERWRGGHDDSH